uniref:Uncharacterized protein n=1 Tax=Chrysemys picta bellii TaxID=8478 RepID=A0A8C3IUC7_CHRPI
DLTAPPPPPLTDTAVKSDTSSPREPIDLNGNDLAEINLHSVESISDLYWVSGGHKAAEGEDYSPQGLPVLQASWAGAAGTEPLMSGSLYPELKSPGRLARAIAGFPLSPAVLQSESLRVLSQWLEAQEESVRQMRATSLQLWKRLNISEAGDQM